MSFLQRLHNSVFWPKA